MKSESRALCRELLLHHSAKIKAHPPGKRVVVTHYTIAYSDLCARAGVSHLTRIVGNFLVDVAEWCAVMGYPALNALAVNASTGMPGDGYDGAGGFAIVNWPQEVEDCIRFSGYPVAPPP